MKLVRYLDGRQVAWVAVDADSFIVRRIAGEFGDWAPAVAADGPGVLRFEGEPTPLSSVKLLAPINDDADIVGSGVNYGTWALPPEGVDTCFEFKSRSSFIGTDETLLFPKFIAAQPMCEYRYELELGLVIGIPLDEPTKEGIKHVLGYTVVNDGCLRHQRPSYLAFDWIGSKCGYHSSSAGPWIVTRDEFGDATPDLRIITRVNDVITRDARTSAMRWDVNRLLEELSWRMGMRASDLLFAGTPGYIDIPDGMIAPGDKIEFEIERIGTLRHVVENKRFASVQPARPELADFDELLARALRWDGTSSAALKPVIEALMTLDPDDRKGWMERVRAYLRTHNTELWPQESSDAFDWWAIESTYLRLFTEKGKRAFKIARRMRVGRDEPWHYRRIGDSQPFDPADAQLRISHPALISPHPVRAYRMMGGEASLSRPA